MKKLFIIVVMAFAVVSANAQRTHITVGDLPGSIIDNVSSYHSGFTVKDATRILTDNVITYEVVIARGNTQETLLYDQLGKFVKKIGAKEGTSTKKYPPSQSHKKAPVKAQTRK